MHKVVFLALFALGIHTPLARAMSCHCFPTRVFDSAKPVAADPYFLATTQNAFMAVVFFQEKKDIVLTKQKPGVTAEGVWIAHWLSVKAGKEVGELLRAQRNTGSWRGAVTSLHVDMHKLPPQFAAILNRGTDEAALSRFIVDSGLAEKELVSRGELEVLRRNGATDQETTLASILARKTGQRPSQLFKMVRKGEASWGELLQKAGIDGGKMVDEIRALLTNVKGRTVSDARIRRY